MASRYISRKAFQVAVAYNRSAPRTSASVLSRTSSARSTITPSSLCLRAAPIRWHSAPPSSPKVYDFAGVKSFTESPSEDRIIIDVREPAEYEGGYIPGAINIPVSSNPDALLLPAEEFEDRFGFPKPSVDKEVVFYCKAGVRSSAAAQLAQQGGYKNIAEYRGSWLDWTKNGGKTET